MTIAGLLDPARTQHCRPCPGAQAPCRRVLYLLLVRHLAVAEADGECFDASASVASLWRRHLQLHHPVPAQQTRALEAACKWSWRVFVPSMLYIADTCCADAMVEAYTACIYSTTGLIRAQVALGPVLYSSTCPCPRCFGCG